MSRRVVITGLGAVTGFGYGVDALWDGLVDGRSTIGPITRFDPTGLRSRVASEAKEFSARDHVPKSYRKAVKVMARDIDHAWWERYRAELERRFRQETLVVRAIKVDML